MRDRPIVTFPHNPLAKLSSVEEERLTTADLLVQWRDATRAAELAERLAEVATRAADQSDASALASEQIARMAEKAAVAAERASQTARQAANRAAALAAENRDTRLREDEAVITARASESEARMRYEQAHRAEQDGALVQDNMGKEDHRMGDGHPV